MKLRMPKGLFLTFEGGEGAGKSTIIDRLHKHLSNLGLEVVKTKEPGGTPLGSLIRNLLLHLDEKISPKSELFLYLADRSQHVETIILPALESGKIVLCDRYTDSTIAYQGAARSFDLELMKEYCDFATSSLNPDYTLFLDVDPNVGIHRAKKQSAGFDRIEEEGIKFHQKVYDAYQHLIQKEQKRFLVVDASQKQDDVFHLVLEKLSPILEKQYDVSI